MPWPWPVALRGAISNPCRPAPLLSEAARVAVYPARFVNTVAPGEIRKAPLISKPRLKLPVYSGGPGAREAPSWALLFRKGPFPFPSCGFLISCGGPGF